MEKSLLPLKSISDPRMSLSSMFIPIDMTFAIMCGVGLFILLIPFLKTYPESPPPGSQRNTPKVRNALVDTQCGVCGVCSVEHHCYFHICWSSRETGERKSPERTAPHSAGAGRQGRGDSGPEVSD